MFHKKTQTHMCKKTLQCFQKGDMYVSADIINPAALAHVVEFIKDKTIGCDAVKWTLLYPPTIMFKRFLIKCRALNTKVKLFNYTINRPDLNALIEEHSLTIAGCGCLD